MPTGTKPILVAVALWTEANARNNQLGNQQMGELCLEKRSKPTILYKIISSVIKQGSCCSVKLHFFLKNLGFSETMTSTRSPGELLLCRTLLCTIQYKSWNVCGTLHSLLWAKKRQEKVTSGPISGMLKRGLLLSFSWQQTTWIILEVPGHYSMSGGRVLRTETGISVSDGNRKHPHIHIHTSINSYTSTNIEVQWVLLCIGQ